MGFGCLGTTTTTSPPPRVGTETVRLPRNPPLPVAALPPPLPPLPTPANGAWSTCLTAVSGVEGLRVPTNGCDELLASPVAVDVAWRRDSLPLDSWATLVAPPDCVTEVRGRALLALPCTIPATAAALEETPTPLAAVLAGGSAIVVDGLGLVSSSTPGNRTVLPPVAAAVVARFKRCCGESKQEREDASPPRRIRRGGLAR